MNNCKECISERVVNINIYINLIWHLRSVHTYVFTSRKHGPWTSVSFWAPVNTAGDMGSVYWAPILMGRVGKKPLCEHRCSVRTTHVHGPWTQPVNAGVILETREHGPSRSAGATVNDVIITFYLQDACNTTGYQYGLSKWHGSCSRVSKMTPLFTGRVCGPWTRVVYLQHGSDWLIWSSRV